MERRERRGDRRDSHEIGKVSNDRGINVARKERIKGDMRTIMREKVKKLGDNIK